MSTPFIGIVQDGALREVSFFGELKRLLQTEDGFFEATVVLALPRPPQPQC